MDVDFPLDGWDLIVIGAGIGGLTCAALAADAGLKTLVLDKHSKLGGYAQYFGKEPTFDAATWFYPGCAPGGPVDATLGPLGLWRKVDAIPLDPAFRFRFPEHDLLVSVSRAATGTLTAQQIHADEDWRAGGPGVPPALVAAFPDQAEALHRASAVFDAIGRAVENGDRNATVLVQHDRHTAHEVFAACGVGARTEAVAGALWPFLGLPPEKVDALAFGFLWRLAYLAGGIHAMRGGAKAFSAALAALIEERGGQVVSRTQVARVRIEGGRATGVVLADGCKVSARAVVTNADPYQTFRTLVGSEHLDDATRERLGAWRPSLSAVLLHFVAPEPAETPAQVTLLHGGYDPAAEYADTSAEEPTFGAVAVGVPTQSEPARAEGLGMVFAMSPASYERPDGWNAPAALRRDKAYRALAPYIALKERLGDRLMRRVEEVLPGVSVGSSPRRIATPVTLERYTFNQEGAAFGWANTPDQGLRLRPGPQTCVPGLFQCGHWTYPGGGIAAVTLSGRWAARAVLASR